MDLSTTPIIFLDIDGVLQPFSSEKRFDIDRKELQETLAVKFKDDIYTKIDEYDVAAVWEDWNTEAVQNLKYLLDTAGAKIVLSTGWRRFRVRKELMALFRLHGLDGYITGQTRLLDHQIEKLHIALGRRAVTVTNHDEFFNRRCLDLALSVL